MARILEDEYPATVSEVLNAMGLDKARQDHKASARVNKIAISLGYEYKSTRAKTRQPHKAWLRKDPQTELMPKDDDDV